MIRLLLDDRLAERSMTQADLARLTGIRAATINDWYWNSIKSLDLDHLETICRALDCDLCDVMTMHYSELKAVEQIIRRGNIAGAFSSYLKETGKSLAAVKGDMKDFDESTRRLALLFALEYEAGKKRSEKKKP